MTATPTEAAVATIASLRYAAAGGAPWKVDVSLWRLGDAPRELYFDPDARRRGLTAETRGAILWIKDTWHRRPC